MKIAALLLMLSGWIIALAAMALLATLPSRTAFVLAGILVELLGFVLFARAHLSFVQPGERRGA